MRNNIVHPTITKEEIEQAKALDLLAYMQLYEPSAIKKSGRNEYCLVEHDSLKMSNGFWFWHSRGFGAQSALDFMVKVRGMDFVDAVRLLSNGIPARMVPTPTTLHSKPKTKPTQEKLFSLPETHKNNFRAIAYLQSRGIAKDVIDQCIADGLLYEGKKYSNVVFVGKDKENAPHFACVRSIKGNFRQDIEGSSKAYSFSVREHILNRVNGNNLHKQKKEMFTNVTINRQRNGISKINMRGLCNTRRFNSKIKKSICRNIRKDVRSRNG